MSAADLVTVIFVTAGIGFFLAGTVGLLRFPDPHTRLHALSKADNLGLGLIAIGLAFQMPDGWSIAKLGLVWLLTILAATTITQLIARAALDHLPEVREDADR